MHYDMGRKLGVDCQPRNTAAFSPPRPPHRSVGYIRCVLQGPGNNRGQECQIVLFHMAVFIDAWLGSAPGNHRGRVCVCVWLGARKT